MGDELVRIRENHRCLIERIDSQRRSREQLLQKFRTLGPHFAAAQDLCDKASVADLLDLQKPLKKLQSSSFLKDDHGDSKNSDSVAETNVREMVANCLLWTTTPIDSASLARRLPSEGGLVQAVESALRALSSTAAVEIEECNGRVIVLMVDKLKVWQQLSEGHCMQSRPGFWPPPMFMGPSSAPHHFQSIFPGPEHDINRDLDSLLSRRSFLEAQKSRTGEELLDLLHRPTAKQTAVAAKFRTKGGSGLREYCPDLTKEDCRYRRGSFLACEKTHFRRVLALHTDVKLGDCSFLDTCRHLKTCKYVHYELDSSSDMPGVYPSPSKALSPQKAEYCSELELGEPQWINCDIRSFKMEILGQFGVIMADPPWDIHMELPYGTMSDDEMRGLNVPVLQTDGLIFLWVTGRAMELGRECLELWGYRRVEELIWVKTNQLQRIIRTGRTGHWLNHSKEHCLVGIKGNPEVNRNIDTDVIVAEVRETSRKPDEMYPMLERLSPGTRKLELFARMHNTHAGWISLGNQLSGVRLVEEGLRSRFKAAYPELEIEPA